MGEIDAQCLADGESIAVFVNIDFMLKINNAQNAEEVEKVYNTLSYLNIVLVASYVLLDWFKLVSKPGRCSVCLGALPVWPTVKCPKHF